MNRKETINIWVLEHGDYLFNYILSKMPDEESAKDVLQDTFLAAFTNYAGFKEQSTPRTWLLSILKHKIADHYRNEFKHANMIAANYHLHGVINSSGEWLPGHAPTGSNTEVNVLDDEEFLYILHDCISKLPPKLKKAVLLRYYNNKTGSKICQELDISPTNFWQILHRSKIRLRACLERNWFKIQKT